jgi:hypothetical protein
MTATTKPRERRAHIYLEDIEPRKAKPAKVKLYKIGWGRKDMGRFLKEQMFYQGYFVNAAKLKAAQASQKARRFKHQTRFRHPSGQRQTEEGVWAVGLLADQAELAESTILRMMQGDYIRGPFLFSVLKVFKALGVDLVGVPGKPDVAMIVTGW